MATLELVVSEFIILALVCFFLIRYYKGNMVTFDVAVAVYLSWVLGFAGILLLPFDISVAVVEDQQSDSLVKVWNFIYWRYQHCRDLCWLCNSNFLASWCDHKLHVNSRYCDKYFACLKKIFKSCSSINDGSTFILAWVILPMQMEYHNSGHFTFTDKVTISDSIIFYLNSSGCCFYFKGLLHFIDQTILLFTKTNFLMKLIFERNDNNIELFSVKHSSSLFNFLSNLNNSMIVYKKMMIIILIYTLFLIVKRRF